MKSCLALFLMTLPSSRIALDQRHHEVLCLLQVMCGGSGGTSGSVLHFEHHRPIRRQRLVPCRAQSVGIIDINALQADELGEFVIGNVRDLLGGVEFRSASP